MEARSPRTGGMESARSRLCSSVSREAERARASAARASRRCTASAKRRACSSEARKSSSRAWRSASGEAGSRVKGNPRDTAKWCTSARLAAAGRGGTSPRPPSVLRHCKMCCARGAKEEEGEAPEKGRSKSFNLFSAVSSTVISSSTSPSIVIWGQTKIEKKIPFLPKSIDYPPPGFLSPLAEVPLLRVAPL